MGRKKKNEYDLEDIDEDFSDEEEDVLDEEENNNSFSIDENNNLDDETPNSPMSLAHQISKESDTYKNFKDLPREVKFSFLDKDEKVEVKHHSRAYRTWKYIEKIIDLRIKEDKQIKESKMELVNIKSDKDLINYFESINRDYLINLLDDLEDEEFKSIIQHLNNIKHNYLLDTLENKKDNIKMLYDEYLETNTVPGYIDDMDNIGKVVDTAVVSMGYKGNASTHSVMTINAVKNENIERDIKEKTRFSLLDTIKGKLG